MKKAVCNLTIEAAVANQGGATFSLAKPMEADTISKNGASSKSHTSRIQLLSYLFVSILVVLAVFIGCKKDKPEVPENTDHEDELLIVYIGEETNWDVMIAGKDGSSAFLNVDENSDGLVTKLYFKPDKNSDEGFSIFFQKNGLPETVVVGDYIFYFGNYRKNLVDVALIHSDNTIEYFYDIDAQIDWGSYFEMSNMSRKSNISCMCGACCNNWTELTQKQITDALKLATCTLGILTSPTGIGIPLLVLSCGTAIVSVVNDYVLPEIIPGLSEISNEVGMYTDFVSCLTGNLVSCIQGAASYADSETANFFGNLFDNPTIVQASAWLSVGIEITVGNLQKFKELGIVINDGNNPPQIEGTYFVSPLTLVRSNFSDALPGTVYWIGNGNMDVTFSEQNNTSRTVKLDYSIANGYETGNGLNAFITGEGNKFSIFVEIKGIIGGYPYKNLQIHSGKITDNGIEDYQFALICIESAPTSIKIGQGRLWKDGDGISERISTDISEIVGVWKGRYSSGTVTLIIDDDMTGVFDFVHNNGSKGSYKVSVNYTNSRFNVIGSEWIVRPSGSWSMVNLTGGIISNGVLSGSNFELWKVE